VVGYGFAIEIEDRGLGMTAEELETANDQLRNPPEFRLTSTARLGLYVVGKLAERHGIRVRLTESPYGGTTAIVLIPGTLMADDGAEESSSTGTIQVDARPAQLAGVGRHRLRGEPEAGAMPAPGTRSGGPADGQEVESSVVVADRTGNGTARAAGPVHDVPLFLQSLPSAEVTAPAEPSVTTAAPSGTAAGAPAPSAPKLTPSGLPWRQRPSSPGEPAPAKAAAPPAAPIAPQVLASPASPQALTSTDADPERPATAPEVESDAEPTVDTANGAGGGAVRDPDQTRSLMASYRSGTLRGRTDAARLVGQDRHRPEWTESSSEPRATEEEG